MEAVCIASGPSLTLQDVLLVKAWREAAENRFVVVVNNCFKIAPWADILYAMDYRWWNVYADEVKATFFGERITCSQAYLPHQLVHAPRLWPWENFGNSGAGGVQVARFKGARRVVLVGYDCYRKTHWHGDHPSPLYNCQSISVWPRQFQRLANKMKTRNVQVLNASRATALKCWPTIRLEDALV
jgi:hypothetical protein